MRVAAFKRNGKILGEFTSIREASCLLGITMKDIARVMSGKTRTAWAAKGNKRKFGALVFRELDNEKQHSKYGRS